MELTLRGRLDKLLDAYSHLYDIDRDVSVEGVVYPATATYFLRDENYLISRQHVLSAVEQHEYLYFCLADRLGPEELLGMNGYEKIWSLFGSANQLLAALGLLAVAAWLGKIGKDNKMFLLPMAFMLCVSIASLYVNTETQLGNIAKGAADWGPYAQVILGILLIFLAVILSIEGCVTIYHQFRKAKART